MSQRAQPVTRAAMSDDATGHICQDDPTLCRTAFRKTQPAPHEDFVPWPLDLPQQDEHLQRQRFGERDRMQATHAAES
ncbi:hypothetical protein LTR95_003295 [Oleoguttula sp. CCFEE 5521]